MGLRYLRLATVATLALTAITACGPARPAPLADGRYRLMATSSGPVADLTLTLSGSSLLVSGDSTARHLTGEQRTATVCPGADGGDVFVIDRAVALGDLDLRTPGLFGDCGVTRPRRVTLVDLSSARPGEAPPYAVWAEFCDVTDPDCPAAAPATS